MSQPSRAHPPGTPAGVCRARHPGPVVPFALGYLLALTLLAICLQWVHPWCIPDPWYWLLLALDIALPVWAVVIVVRQREPMPQGDQLVVDRLAPRPRDDLRRAVRRGEVSADPREAALQVTMARSMLDQTARQLPWYMFPAALWPAVSLSSLQPHGLSGLFSLACWGGAATSWANGRRARRFLAVAGR